MTGLARVSEFLSLLQRYSDNTTQSPRWIRGPPLVSTHSLLVLNQIRLLIPRAHIAYSHSQSPTVLWAQELLISMQKPGHQNKLCLPEGSLHCCAGLLVTPSS